MSDPVDTTKVGKYQAIQSALCELVSAESSLNMYPDPIEAKIIRTVDVFGNVTAEPEPRYLTAVDANVKHAIEHVHAAFRLMNMAHHDQEALKTQVYKLVVQLKELGAEPRIKTWLDVCSRCNSAEISTEAAFCASCMASLTPTDEESSHCEGCGVCEGCPARAGAACIECENCDSNDEENLT